MHKLSCAESDLHLPTLGKVVKLITTKLLPEIRQSQLHSLLYRAVNDYDCGYQSPACVLYKRTSSVTSEPFWMLVVEPKSHHVFQKNNTDFTGGFFEG